MQSATKNADHWRDAGVAEEARLESVWPPKGAREFESRSLREFNGFADCFAKPFFYFGLMHFRLARNKGATYVTLLWIASQKWIVADINEYHSLSLSSFSETKMRANVTHKHHPTLSGNEKRCLCIPKVRNKSSCACRIVSQMRKRLIMPPLIVRPHPREAKSWENVS